MSQLSVTRGCARIQKNSYMFKIYANVHTGGVYVYICAYHHIVGIGDVWSDEGRRFFAGHHGVDLFLGVGLGRSRGFVLFGALVAAIALTVSFSHLKNAYKVREC